MKFAFYLISRKLIFGGLIFGGKFVLVIRGLYSGGGLYSGFYGIEFWIFLLFFIIWISWGHNKLVLRIKITKIKVLYNHIYLCKFQVDSIWSYENSRMSNTTNPLTVITGSPMIPVRIGFSRATLNCKPISEEQNTICQGKDILTLI